MRREEAITRLSPAYEQVIALLDAQAAARDRERELTAAGVPVS